MAPTEFGEDELEMPLHIGHLAARKAAGPGKVSQQFPHDNAVDRFNSRLALAITKIVGSVWCAYVFGLFDLISLPAAIRGGSATIVSWVAQTFLQLVLLSVIMVGQNVQAAAADKRAEDTFVDAEHLLLGQDAIHAKLEAIETKIGGGDTHAS